MKRRIILLFFMAAVGLSLSLEVFAEEGLLEEGLLYIGTDAYTSVYDGGFTNRYYVSGEGDTFHYAYCLQPDAPDPSGSGFANEADNFNIKLVLCLGLYGPAQQYGYDAGIWPGTDEYNAGALLPAAYGYVHATVGYLYGAGPGIGLYSEHVAQLDGWVQACLNIYENNPEVKKIVDNSKLFYLYGGNHQDIAWVEYIPPKNGWIELRKASEYPAVSVGEAYSLDGAVYGIYDGSGTEVMRLTTDAEGYAKSGELPEGSYTVKEITPPKGYDLNAQPYNVSVTADETTTLSTSDIPQYAVISMLLKKTADTDFGYPLAYAEFIVKYYGQEAAEGTPERTWAFKTDGEGSVLLNNDYKISGDDLYVVNGQPVLPLGIVTIQETKAPEGYRLNGTVFQCPITSEVTETPDVSYRMPVVEESLIRGDFKFIKNSDDGTPMAGVMFRITSEASGESYVVTSHEDGLVTSKDIRFEDTYESGGSLPYGVYLVEELACDANSDYRLAEPFKVFISENDTYTDIGIVENIACPKPETSEETETPDEPEIPEEPETPEESETSKGTEIPEETETPPETTKTVTKSPKTGDEHHPTMLLVVFIGSGMVWLFALIKLRKYKSRRK